MEPGDWIESVSNSTARPADLALLFVVACRANAEGACRIPQAELSKWLNCNGRAIRRSLARLVAAGELTVIPGAGRRPSEFRLLTGSNRADTGVRPGRTPVTGQSGHQWAGSPMTAPTSGANGEPAHTSGRTRADAGDRPGAQPVTGYMVKEPVASCDQPGVSVLGSPRLFCMDVLKLHPKTAAMVVGKLMHLTDREALGRLRLWKLYAGVQARRGGVTSISGYVATGIRRGYAFPDWFVDEIGKHDDPAIRELARYL